MSVQSHLGTQLVVNAVSGSEDILFKSLEKPTHQDHNLEHHVHLVICKTHEPRYLSDDVRVAFKLLLTESDEDTMRVQFILSALGILKA